MDVLLTRRARAAWFSVWPLLIGAGCSAREPVVGQSGSENLPSGEPHQGGDTAPCPCGERDGLRVTLIEQHEDVVRLRVEEIVMGTPPVAVGDEIEATRFDDRLACYAGCYAPQIGDEAFAFYAAAKQPVLPACAARSACLDACEQENLERYGEGFRSECQCRAEPSPRASEHHSCGGTNYFGADEQGRDCRAECEQETAESCPPLAALDAKRGTVALSPWSDPIVFARSKRGEVSVPVAELSRLSREGQTLQACIERFGDWSSLLK